ncbi:calmodulin-lysine N-methyltransferase-like isoform X2 [Lycium ferocissimum]|uniref:calmodulin-lysine N-methyltransferase-like isoform X2 n=1 Tax=Lycium ferocissimum TaxID=112874 RepID=UPI002814AD54|nr:calmodulin-lysine N-methyltransferase-like isoform X2 [Lycium ferocissimum]
MEANNSKSNTSASSLRWKILRRSLIRRPSSNSDKSEIGIQRISRKATLGFNLIPYYLMKDSIEENVNSSKENSMHSSRDATLCYTLPILNAPQLILHQRVDDRAHLNDFEVCNRYDIDNTGLVCQWPSEDVLAHYCLSHASIFRQKRVIELGSGYGLAGLVVAMTSEAQEVFISDGNPQVVDYIQRNVNANSGSFGGTEVKPLMLHWGQENDIDISNTFDVIIASDCTFFKEFHGALVRTIKSLLKEEGPSEAILLSPRRGNSLDKFLVEVKDRGLRFRTDEIYDEEVWRRHQGFVEGDDSWPNYEMDHCYPLLVRITR